MVMKTNFTLLTAALFTATLPAIAGPLQRADVPANVQWVAHMDCAGLRPTVVGKYLLAEMEKPEAQAKFAAFQAVFSFDPRKQLHGLTLYSTSTKPEDGVLLIYADFDAERLTTLAKAARDYRSTEHKGCVIHDWLDEKKPAKDGVQPRVFAAIAGKIVLFGQQEASVTKALDVLDRTSPSLATSSLFPRLGNGGSQSLIEAATQKLTPSDSDPNAAVTKLARMLQLQVAESAGQTTAKLTLEASTDEVAGSITSVLQGLIGLMKLQEDKPEAAKFAKALTLKQEGASVNLSLAMSAEDVVVGMKADAARKAAQKKTEP